MATIPASESFGHFVGDVCALSGRTVGRLETWIVTTVQTASPDNSNAQGLCAWYTKHQAGIAQTFFALGVLYNCYKSTICFTVGFALGIVASLTNRVIYLPHLRNGQVLGHTREQGYAIQRAMFGIAFVNSYLGDNFFEDAVLGGTAGLLAGNAACFITMEQPLIKGCIEIVGRLFGYPIEAQDDNTPSAPSD